MPTERRPRGDGWEQLLDLDAEDLGEELNLSVGGDAPSSFDVGQDVASHVTTQQLHLGHEIVLGPATLVSLARNIPANYIGDLRRHFVRPF